MKTQNFKTHGRLVTGYHKVLYPMLLAGLVGSCINLSQSCANGNCYAASLIVLLFLIGFVFSVSLSIYIIRSILDPINHLQHIMTKLANGFFYNRSGDIQIVLKPGYIDGNDKGTTHGLWYPYDAHIPLLWYGFGIKQGKSNREVYMHDIASTIAALLHIQMPSGNIGKPIEEVLK